MIHPCTKALAGLLLAGALVAGSSPVEAAQADPAPEGERLTVFVSILPQSWFVERIGGPDVEVFFLVGPGDSPASFEPAPRDLARLSDADLMLTIGVPFERMLLPRLREQRSGLHVEDMAEGIERREIDASEAHGHGQESTDPHVWLDPQRAETLARNTRDALARLRPQQSERYDENLRSVLRDLRATDASVRERLAPFEGATVLVFHPAFGYFTDRYGLEQLAIQSGGLEPSPRELARTIERAERLGIRTVFAQPQSPSASVTAVAEAIDGSVEVLNPLAADYLDNLERIGEAVSGALRSSRRAADR
jgi:zinc transport system substrate-binding protein